MANPARSNLERISDEVEVLTLLNQTNERMEMLDDRVVNIDRRMMESTDQIKEVLAVALAGMGERMTPPPAMDYAMEERIHQHIHSRITAMELGVNDRISGLEAHLDELTLLLNKTNLALQKLSQQPQAFDLTTGDTASDASKSKAESENHETPSATSTNPNRDNCEWPDSGAVSQASS